MNQRKHKIMRKLQGRHQEKKKGHEGKWRMMWKVNGRWKGMQQGMDSNTEKNNMILRKG